MAGLFPSKVCFEALKVRYHSRGWCRVSGYAAKEILESFDVVRVAKELWPEN